MNTHSIWQEKQNKPTLVVNDLSSCLQSGISDDVIYGSLLRRGIFKWMACRRDIIKTKIQLRHAVTFSNEMIHAYRSLPVLSQTEKFDMIRAAKINYWRGYLKGVQFAYMCLVAICHSDRWRAPDNDTKAIKWLEGKNGKN